MKIVSLSYTHTVQFTDPVAWLQHINFYTGILEALFVKFKVDSIEQINCTAVLQSRGVNYHFLNTNTHVRYLPWQLHRYVKKLKPDVVFINGLIFPLQVIQLRWKLGKSVKIILLHRGEKPHRGIKRLLQKMADKYIDAYLFASAEFGKAWTKFGNISHQNKIHEVIQASSVFKPQKRSGTSANRPPVFLWVGRLDANKDPLTVVKAFIEFLKCKPAAKLFMIFQSELLLHEVKSLIATTSNADAAIKLIGKIPHEELQKWYNEADYIISGSHHEGSGIAVCEAMSCGCIPVLTDIISFRKMTGPGNCGLLYKPGNVAALVKCLMQTTEMDTATEMEKTLQQFKAELSFEAVAKKIERVIALLQHQ